MIITYYSDEIEKMQYGNYSNSTEIFKLNETVWQDQRLEQNQRTKNAPQLQSDSISDVSLINTQRISFSFYLLLSANYEKD